MEATAVSIGKSVLNGALGYAKSTVAEEVALQLGIQQDQAFVTDELEMMQGFLMEAHEERDGSKVIKIWVKQVRDVAYDVEDCLQDFALRVHKQPWTWWRIPRTLLDRRQVVTQMKELRTKVEDVSQRNVRYRLIKGSSSTEPAAAAGQSSIAPAAAAAAMFGVDGSRHAAKQHQSRSDLAQLINKEGDDLGVIAVWGTSGHIGYISVISEAYENQTVKLNFPCRAWVRLTRSYHPKEFIQSIVKQFREAVGVTDALLEPEEPRTGTEVAQEYNGYVENNRYLIVLTDLTTIEEWYQIKACFPENKLGSRIIVSTEQVEVASLSPGQDSMVSELKQLSADQTIYAFYNKSSHVVTNSSKSMSTSSKLLYTAENGIEEDQFNTRGDAKIMVQERFTGTNTMRGVQEEVQIIGRQKEKSDIIELIREQASTQQFEVIALWGMGGLGKTTLIKDVYQRHEVTDMFGKYAFVTVLRPFKLEEFLRSLVLQLDARKGAMDFAGDTQKNIASMGVADLTEVLGRRSQGNSCLFVLDDLSSATEWEKILSSLLAMRNPSLVIVITTRREDIAKHCCKKLKCIRLLNGLQEKDACNLFTKKVFKNETTDLAKDYPELVEPAKLILKRCNGLPLAIVTIGGFLADQPTKTVAEWRKLNEHISVDMEMNPKFGAIKMVLIRSYDGLPYYLKSCFLYLSIFPEDYNVRRRRLVCRWIAEGYARDKSAAERYFMELVERSMILPVQRKVCSTKGFDSCQLHDLIRDISIAKSMEENLVFRLEEGCSSNSHGRGAVRHLAISNNWEGDELDLESTVELSRIRSLTVFGKWKPFYISDKMRFLRVLDLERTEGLADHHLEHMGKLLHLIYLSLRGCDNIFHLPDSVGNLTQLETLDIKNTLISVLPKTIIKLRKLHYLQAGTIFHDSDNRTTRHCPDKCGELLTPCCIPRHMHFNKCTGACAPFACCMKRAIPYGVKVPRGIGKLKSLYSLRNVNLAWGNAVIQEIKGLTCLRKLGVVGLNMKNGLEFCSAVSGLRRLEYLAVRSVKEDLYDCLDGISSPPEDLKSIKLHGCQEKLPKWIKGLQNLTKLKLEGTKLSGDGETMHVLGNLPNLSILRLRDAFIQIEGPVTFQSGLFRSLMVLELDYQQMRIESLKFEPTSMPKLEVFRLRLLHCTVGISLLEFLPSIKEVRLSVQFLSSLCMEFEVMTEEAAEMEAKRREDKVKEDIRKQFASVKKGHILKFE
ncbi:unnamed protein product [Alopecurus aequalis]